MEQNNEVKKERKQHNYKFESNRKYFTICIYALGVIAVGALLVYLIVNLEQTRAGINKLITTLLPFIIACFIAYMVNPIYHFFKLKVFSKSKKLKPKAKNAISLLVSYIVFLGLIIVFLLYVIPQFSKSIGELATNVPIAKITTSISKLIGDLENRFPWLDFEAIQKWLNNTTPQLMDLGTGLLKSIFPTLVNISVSLVRILLNIILSLVISIYILSNKETLTVNAKRLLYAIVNERKADIFASIANDCNHIFGKFIIGKSIDSLIIGILCYFLMLILRLPYALLISVVVGVTNMIPYFGPFIGATPGVIIYLLINPIQAIIFAVMILALQQFDGLYLGPKILGESTGLKPLWIIFAITIGGAYYGVLGMFLGVPVVAVISYLLNRFISYRLEQKNISSEN